MLSVNMLGIIMLGGFTLSFVRIGVIKLTDCVVMSVFC
jgi:hypothetical protein